MIFITTREMEGNGDENKSRSRWLERAAGIEIGSTRRIVVKEDSWADIEDKLKQISSESSTNYIVNLTGGTKVMTLALFRYFAQSGNRIFYVPFPKNEYCELYPNLHAQPAIITFRCTLSQYLATHGLYYTCNNVFVKEQESTFNLFLKAKNADFRLHEIEEIKYAHQSECPEDKCYYSGGWFEEYMYHLIKKYFKLSQSRIALNVNLYRNPDDVESDNEYDLMFVHENALFVVECKTSLGKSLENARKNIDRYLYKLGAITRDFGLKVNSYIVTLTQLRNTENKLSEKLEKRQKILGVKAIFDQSSFYHLPEMIHQLKPKLSDLFE